MGAPDFESTVSRLYESILDPTQWMGALRLITQCLEDRARSASDTA